MNGQNKYITTERLQIRNLKIEDLSAFHSYRSNPEVTRFQGFDVMTMDEARQFIISQKDKIFGVAGEWVQYGIEHILSKNLIGDCAIKLYSLDTAEIGITISPGEQRKGYAKETMQSLLGFLFSNNIRRVVEITDVENIGSVNLLKSAGFRLEGHFIENIFFKGIWGSEYQYAMLKREWEEK